MVKYAKDEIDQIRLCHTCYDYKNRKPNNWFTAPCSPPHILLWAQKPHNNSYWPAKLIKVIDDAQRTVVVQFFGAINEMTQLSARHCFLMSRKSVGTEVSTTIEQKAAIRVKYQCSSIDP